ncbi:N-acetylmuramoyl-L-alanine amidase [Nonomuraea sp. B19D2]|uniref:N-acetylmuramoyl-L-alanine amidase n=1 Tax=Nonomuraea sp. B19D2 TaxID=3159561 RepID=UPI0032DA8E3F
MHIWLAATLIAATLTWPASVPARDHLARPDGPGTATASKRQTDSAASPSKRRTGSTASPSKRQADFAVAARQHGVPESVLLGVSYLESRWDANGGSPSTAGGYGPMHLVDTLPAVHRGLGDALGDARGDDARPMSRTVTAAPPLSALRMADPPATLPQAGRLIGADPASLRADPAANIRAGAALLASYQDRPSADPVDWYEAVARYSGAEDAATAHEFADEVFSVMREGAERRTDDGFLVRLDPVPDLPAPEEKKTENVGKAGNTGQVECPESLACEWMPAAYERFGKKKSGNYGNHDHLSRTRTVDYIIIHDTEGTYRGIPSMVGDPKYVSWHYTIRSGDGHVAQHVPTNDIAWHAGNWDVNTRSIGVEHEGYLAKGGTWYTEAMYRSSAKLVEYLAGRYDIPLNRAHILGHDNVPGSTPKAVSGMHQDPGPYWDWAHYFDLLNKPLKGAKNGDSIMIRPPYGENRPRFTGCGTAKPGKDCPAHGATTVWLHKEPSESSPLISDPGKHPGKPGTYSVYDHSARASTGQRYAVAARQGDWTAIWYLGQKAWFYNPPSKPTAVPAKGPLVTPLKPGTKVYGRAYPEKSAYKLASHQPLTPLQYKIGPGQTYTVGDTVTGSYYAAGAFSPAKHVTTTGQLRYYQIQLGHRVMFVMTKDMRLIE